MSNGMTSNEEKFFAKMKEFIEETQGVVKPQDESAFVRLVRSYEKESHPDVIQNLVPGQAKTLLVAKNRIAPDFVHPFFLRVEDIASQRWGKEIQEIFDAINYQLQVDLGAKPSLKPSRETHSMIKRVFKPSWLPQGSVNIRTPSIPKEGSNMSGVLRFIKENW